MVVLNQLEARALKTMLEVRGFAYSYKNSFLEAGRRSLAEAKKTLQEAKDLAAASPHLLKLKEEVPHLEALITGYERNLNDTVAQVEKVKQIRQSMDAAAKNFTDNIQGYLKEQNDSLSKEIKAGADQAKLSERLEKNVLANDIADLGEAVRIANFKAQALNDPHLVQAVLDNFEQIQQKVNTLTPQTHTDSLKKLLAGVESAAQAYKKTIQDMLLTWQEQENLYKKRQDTADQVLGDAGAAAAKGVEGMQREAATTMSSLGSALVILLLGMGLILVLGVISSLLITKTITRTVNRIADSLSAGSEQVAAAATQVSSASQSLAQGSSEQAASLEETSASLEEMSSMTRTNADNARQADALMGETAKVVGNGQPVHGRPHPVHAARCRRPARRPPRSSRPSTKSPSRPIFWPSMPRWRPPGPGRRGPVSRWWPTRCGPWPCGPPRPPRTPPPLSRAR